MAKPTAVGLPTNEFGAILSEDLAWAVFPAFPPSVRLAVLVGDTIITGISANGASTPATATFRGAIVALNAQTGAIRWRTYSLPDNGDVPGGYAGATMFSPPAVDEALGLVYGTFGQPYTEPPSVTLRSSCWNKFLAGNRLRWEATKHMTRPTSWPSAEI